MNKQYKEIITKEYVIREFSQNIDPAELHWHKDEEDRVIEPLSQTNWMFQRDNQLPEKIENKIYLKKNEWHRVIKGDGNLLVKITRM